MKKVLYIYSGYRQIYRYFDQAIEDGFESLNINFFTIKHNVPLKTFKETIEKVQPDLIFTFLGYKLQSELLIYLRSIKTPSCVWLSEDPFYIDQSLKVIRYFDFIFTIDQGALQYYEKRNNIFHLPLGTDPTIFHYHHDNLSEYKSEICFIGFPYSSRTRLFTKLIKELPFQITFIGGKWGATLGNLTKKENVKVISRWVKPEEVALFYNGAKINLNTHRPFDEKFNKNKLQVLNKSINNRTFDIASCRAFQLIEHMPDLHERFTDEEITSFKNETELIELIYYFMENETERKLIAKKAEKRALKEHTFKERLKQIISKVQQNY